MVNDCQGRGRRYLASIYYDRRLRRSFLDADFGMSVGVYQAPVFVFFFFLLSLSLISRFSLSTLSSIHIPLSLSVREVASGSRQSEVRTGPWILHAFLCCLLRRGLPTHTQEAHKRWAFSFPFSCVSFMLPHVFYFLIKCKAFADKRQHKHALINAFWRSGNANGVKWQQKIRKRVIRRAY